MTENLIEQHLKVLSLHRISESYKVEADKAAKAKLGYQDYLQRLLEIEVINKDIWKNIRRAYNEK